MGTYYDTRKLNAAFWSVNVFILLMMIAWFVRELFPEWRGYQTTFVSAERELVWREILDTVKTLTGGDDKEVEAAMRPVVGGREELQTALAELAKKHPDTEYAKALQKRLSPETQQLREQVTRLRSEFEEAKRDLFSANRVFQDANAHLTWATDEYFNAKPGTSQKAQYAREMETRREIATRRQKVVDEKGKIYNRKEKEKVEAEKKLIAAEIMPTRMESGDDEIGVQLDGIPRRIDIGSLITRLQAIDSKFSPLGTKVEIQQTLIDNAGASEEVEDVQRCKTCHMGIDSPDLIPERWTAIPEAVRKRNSWPAEMPVEYRYHPRYTELFSNHPVERFGCTTCHRGQGVALTSDAAHGRFKGRYKDTKEKYHHVERPFFHVKYREAACARCHIEQTEITGAPVLSAGKRIFEQYGCVGCHEMGEYRDAPKIGPSLEKVSKKLDPKWMYRWIRNPRHFSPKTKMPQLFETGREFELKGNAKINERLLVVRDVTIENRKLEGHDAEDQARDVARADEDVRSIVSFLWNSSDDWSGESRGRPEHAAELFDFPDEASQGGDATRGEMLVKGEKGQRGCVACHTLGGKLSDEGTFEYKHRSETEPGGRPFGPDLSHVGSKVKPGWLYRWLLDPKKYMKHARMPNLRLTDQEAKDITAYLMQQTFPGEEPAAPSSEELMDKKLVKQGEKMTRQYGCFGCHDIPKIDSVDWDKPKGMLQADWEKLWGGKEKTPQRPSKIGADLSKVGVKAFHELDFGSKVLDLNPTVEDWLKAKILSPRQFRPGRDIKGVPNLKMPNFHLSNREADTLLTVLLSYTGEEMGEHFVDHLDATLKSVEQGRRTIRRRNCVGCHILDSRGGDILTDALREENLGPPVLQSQGLRVQSDWLFTFLKKPSTIRPWIHIRMPTFGFPDEEASRVIRYFPAADRERAKTENQVDPNPPPAVRHIVEEIRQYAIDKGEVLVDFEEQAPTSAAKIEAGRRLFVRLECASCHPRSQEEFEKLPEEKKTQAAPNLGLAKKRINPDFIVQWLKDPQWFQPRTNMPNFFGDRDGGYYSIDNNPGLPPEEVAKIKATLGPLIQGSITKQTEALRDYVLTLSK